MKISVISDIHGNKDALKAVINDIEKKQTDKIFICGDLAMAGPEPVETIDFIIEMTKKYDVTIIQGNTDEMIVKSTGVENDPFMPPNALMAESLKYSQKVLRQDQKDFLANLAVKQTLEIGEVSILLVHGSPRSNSENILPGQKIEKIQEMIEGTTEDLIFCGHTHLPAGYQAEKQTVVNVGSVGRPFTESPQACYAQLIIPDLSKKEFAISHKFVNYDSKTASEKLAKLNFEGSVELAQMLLKGVSNL